MTLSATGPVEEILAEKVRDYEAINERVRRDSARPANLSLEAAPADQPSSEVQSAAVAADGGDAAAQAAGGDDAAPAAGAPAASADDGAAEGLESDEAH